MKLGWIQRRRGVERIRDTTRPMPDSSRCAVVGAAEPDAVHGLLCGVQCVLTNTCRPTVMKTIQMTIDERLLKLVDKLSRARKTTRSAFIRKALESEIRRQRVIEQEHRHAEGYARNPVRPGEFDVWVDEQDWGAT